MNIILMLIPISLVLLGLAVWAFFWAVDDAQFDDLDTPALAPLVEDEPIKPEAVDPASAAGVESNATGSDRTRS